MLSTYQTHVSKVVRSFTRKYHLSHAEADDLEGAIILHLAEVAQDPQIAKAMDSLKYLRTVVLNAGLDHIRALIRQRKRLTSLTDYQTIPAEQIDVDDAIWLSQALNLLTAAQLSVISVYFGLNGMPATRDWEKLAIITGYSRGLCKRLYSSAMTILKHAAK